MTTRTERRDERDEYAREWARIEELKRQIAETNKELARRFPGEFSR
jgi:hypothetical protein